MSDSWEYPCSTVAYVAHEAGVSREVARVALDNSRGNIRVALDLLSNIMCRDLFEREVREYELERTKR